MSICDRLVKENDVGEILFKVHEDLQVLKDKIISNDSRSSKIDISALENAISKTEEGLKYRTEQYINHLSNQVLTLPTVEAQHTHQDNRFVYETPQDVHKPQTIQTYLRADSKPMDNTDSAKKLVGSEIAVSGPSPGQKFKQSWNSRVIQNPYNSCNRDVLNDSFGVQLPLIMNKKNTKNDGIQIIRGSTIEPLAILPKSNRIDPRLQPPAITEADANRGILNLMERGLIPPAAELTLEPSPVRHRPLTLHDPTDKERLQGNLPNSSDAVFHLDKVVINKPSSATEVNSWSGQKRHQISPTDRSISQQRCASGGNISDTNLQPLPPPTTPASGPTYKEKHFRFAFQNGKAKENSNEFVAFKQHYCLSWGGIVTILKHMENMLTEYSIPVAFVYGDKLADLALEFELERAPTKEDLISSIANKEDVESLIKQPGRRFLSAGGRNLAASQIQATYRMHRQRQVYLAFRKKQWAAGVIAISWIMSVKIAMVRKQLARTRADQLDAFRRRAKAFSTNWNRIKQSRRVIIHLPSLGFSQPIRDSLDEFGIQQNTQMSRLCDIEDPNVDVIYLCPVPLNDEMLQYYSKLLALKSAVNSGNVDDQDEVSERYKIIIPEAIKSFPAHRMCLATHLKYSAQTLRRVKNLIRGRDAYIVTGMPHTDDLAVSDYLNVPILAPEPKVAQLYSTKSGSKRIFQSAGVQVPPGEYDVYNLQQLHECLAQLITENLLVTRWLLKLDDEFDGRGIAYVDIPNNLSCYPWAIKEAQRYGEKWKKKWAQEAACIKILAEIPKLLNEHAKPAHTARYPNWQEYLNAFLSQGGVIEACPPSESITAITGDMLITPDGQIELLCIGDQIHAESPLQCWGYSLPQSSIEPTHLNQACMSIAEACKNRAIIGYFSIDFVTFIDPENMEQQLWAVDLTLRYSDSLSSFKLTQFMSNGVFDATSHLFNVPLVKKEERNSRRKPKEDEAPNTSRYAVMSTKLLHTNLSIVHYSVFFQMCRAHGIGYDIKEKQGTAFSLIDSFNRENIGMVTIGDNLQGSLATFARNLSVIHQEISAPNMQGTSNFKPVINDIEQILGTAIQNSNETEQKIAEEKNKPDSKAS